MFNSIDIAESYVPIMEWEKICRAILRSQNIREESWDEEIKFYRVDFSTSALMALEELNVERKNFWSSIIAKWNCYMWNDIQEAAKRRLRMQKIKD